MTMERDIAVPASLAYNGDGRFAFSANFHGEHQRKFMPNVLPGAADRDVTCRPGLRD